MKSLSDLYWFFKGVKVYALVGDSGTGKSFRAKLLAQKYGIQLIVDDGLLIRDDKILAGQSAKREQTFLAAVRVALFDNKAHRDEIARVLQSEQFKNPHTGHVREDGGKNCGTASIASAVQDY